MAVTGNWYTNGPKAATTGAVFTSDTIKVALLGSGYSFNQDTHEFFSDVSASQISAGAGYTAGGATLASKTVTVDAATNETRFDAADTVWTVPSGNTLTAYFAVIYKDTGTASTSPLLGYVNFGGAVTATASGASATFTITWAATGILKITAA